MWYTLRMQRRWLAILGFGVASLMNPALMSGCSSFIRFNYGEPEMLALMNRANQDGPYHLQYNGQQYEVTVALQQGTALRRTSQQDVRITPEDTILGLAFVPTAHACGKRTFVRAAGACDDTTNMPVEGTITVKAIAGRVILDSAAIKGTLHAYGTTIYRASLMLTLDQDTFQLTSTDGKTFTEGELKLRSTL